MAESVQAWGKIWEKAIWRAKNGVRVSLSGMHDSVVDTGTVWYFPNEEKAVQKYIARVQGSQKRRFL
jgi:hypothetical protein